MRLWGTILICLLITSCDAIPFFNADLPMNAGGSQTTYTLYTNNPANVRPCPKVDDTCAVIIQLTAGTEVEAFGTTVPGDEVNGSTEWYQILWDGQTAYVSASLVDAAAPTTTATLMFFPTANPADETLAQAYGALNDVTQVDIVTVQAMDSGGYIVYSEIKTQPGADFATLAALMRFTALNTLDGATLEFSVIFNDGTRCEDHIFDNLDKAWRITPITCPPL